MSASLVGSEMCIRDRPPARVPPSATNPHAAAKKEPGSCHVRHSVLQFHEAEPASPKQPAVHPSAHQRKLSGTPA
eukprot:10250670-Alexandrium_andersonii.AAC.1